MSRGIRYARNEAARPQGCVGTVERLELVPEPLFTCDCGGEIRAVACPSGQPCPFLHSGCTFCGFRKGRGQGGKGDRIRRGKAKRTASQDPTTILEVDMSG